MLWVMIWIPGLLDDSSLVFSTATWMSWSGWVMGGIWVMVTCGPRFLILLAVSISFSYTLFPASFFPPMLPLMSFVHNIIRAASWFFSSSLSLLLMKSLSLFTSYTVLTTDQSAAVVSRCRLMFFLLESVMIIILGLLGVVLVSPSSVDWDSSLDMYCLRRWSLICSVSSSLAWMSYFSSLVLASSVLRSVISLLA